MARQGLPASQHVSLQCTDLDRRDASQLRMIEEQNFVWMLFDRLGEEAFDMDADNVLGFSIDECVEIAVDWHTYRRLATPE